MCVSHKIEKWSGIQEKKRKNIKLDSFRVCRSPGMRLIRRKFYFSWIQNHKRTRNAMHPARRYTYFCVSNCFQECLALNFLPFASAGRVKISIQYQRRNFFSVSISMMWPCVRCVCRCCHINEHHLSERRGKKH